MTLKLLMAALTLMLATPLLSGPAWGADVYVPKRQQQQEPQTLQADPTVHKREDVVVGDEYEESDIPALCTRYLHVQDNPQGGGVISSIGRSNDDVICAALQLAHEIGKGVTIYMTQQNWVVKVEFQGQPPPGTQL